MRCSNSRGFTRLRDLVHKFVHLDAPVLFKGFLHFFLPLHEEVFIFFHRQFEELWWLFSSLWSVVTVSSSMISAVTSLVFSSAMPVISSLFSSLFPLCSFIDFRFSKHPIHNVFKETGSIRPHSRFEFWYSFSSFLKGNPFFIREEGIVSLCLEGVIEALNFFMSTVAGHLSDNPEHVFAIEIVDEFDHIITVFEALNNGTPFCIGHLFPIVRGKSCEESVNVCISEKLTQFLDFIGGHAIEDVLFEVRRSPGDEGSSPLSMCEVFPVLFCQIGVVLDIEVLFEVGENPSDLICSAFVKNVSLEILA